MPKFIIVGYVWQILGRGAFLPPTHLWAAPKKPILNRVNHSSHSCFICRFYQSIAADVCGNVLLGFLFMNWLEAINTTLHCFSTKKSRGKKNRYCMHQPFHWNRYRVPKKSNAKFVYLWRITKKLCWFVNAETVFVTFKKRFLIKLFSHLVWNSNKFVLRVGLFEISNSNSTYQWDHGTLKNIFFFLDFKYSCTLL